MKGRRGFGGYGVLSRLWWAEPSGWDYAHFGLMFALALGFVVAAVIGSSRMAPPRYHDDDLTRRGQEAQAYERALRVEAADVARLSARHRCVPVERSRPDQIPSEMILRQTGGVIERVAWTYPAPAGSWVKALCYGD